MQAQGLGPGLGRDLEAAHHAGRQVGAVGPAERVLLPGADVHGAVAEPGRLGHVEGPARAVPPGRALVLVPLPGADGEDAGRAGLQHDADDGVLVLDDDGGGGPLIVSLHSRVSCE